METIHTGKQSEKVQSPMVLASQFGNTRPQITKLELPRN
jgi:hypothetical protein